jgi:hypothetical protein
MYSRSSDHASFLWKTLAVVALLCCLLKTARAQTTPPFQSHNFQYLSDVLTPAQVTSQYVANAFNSTFPPKYFSLGVTTTATGFVVALQGSLDNVNWSTLAVTNTVFGVVSSILPKPMLYFRLQATTIGANTAVTATAIGVP